MKRKLIDIHQEYLVECDTPSCDFKVRNPTGDINEEIAGFVHIPCPDCGEPLLTVKDYLDSRKLVDRINWVNKWFGWLTVFNRGNRTSEVSIKVNDGVKISNKRVNGR